MNIFKLFVVLAVWMFSLSACGQSPESASTSASQNTEDSFEEPPSPGEEEPVSQTWKIGIISDMNGSYGSTSYSSAVDKAIEYLRQNKVDAVLSTGDMVAGQKSGLDYQAMWNAFHSHATEPLKDAKIPLLPSPGNHDASAGSSFRRERELYVENWNRYPFTAFNPERPSGYQLKLVEGVQHNYPLNYAVRMGPAVFIALDATLTGPLINNQIDWLEEVLRRSTDAKIKIVFGHIPLYPFALNRAHEYLARGTTGNGFYRRMETLLEQYQVQFFFSGHHHVYYPGHRNSVVNYVSVPLLGSGARYLLTADRSVNSRSPQAFLVLEWNSKGEASFQALKASSYDPIPSSDVPSAISVPSRSSSDCSGCGSFPSVFFLNSGQRTLYLRSEF